MIHWNAEGAVKNGLNFYPPGDPASAGFKLKIGFFILAVRYRKRHRDFVFWSQWLPNADKSKLPNWIDA